MTTRITTLESLQLTRLAEQLRQGDARALGLLYERLRKMVFSVALGVLGSVAEAEDVTQDTFLRAWKARQRLREPARIKSWLARIASNLARTRWTRRGRTVACDGLLEQMGQAPTAPDELDQARHSARLRQAIGALTERQAQVVRLRVEEELSFKEIADTLGCSCVSARVNFTYGTRRLREVMAA